MSVLDIVVLVIVVALVLCPPKYDPAIRLKEWTMKKDKR